MTSTNQTCIFDFLESDSHSGINWFAEISKKLKITEKPGWPDEFGKKMGSLYSKTNLKKPIRTLSLFSGAGGLDIGFHDAGFEIVECCELEKGFCKTLEYNSGETKLLKNVNIVNKDIKEYDPNLKNIDFIIGGPPCQTFSAAGARAAGVNGIDDDRGKLFWEYVRILKKLKPKGFLFENVYRIVGAQNGKAWQEIQQAFSKAGYELHWRILDTADFGVPQFRERLFIVGLRKGSFLFPLPTHGPDSPNKLNFYTSGKAVLKTPPEEKTDQLSGRHGHLLNDIPPGLNYSFYTERMGHPTPYFAWRSKFSDYLYKADPETPVRTLKAQGGQYTGPFHWNNRPFTTAELKRLQTIPDKYTIVGPRQKTIQQIGNSVPPQIARILALSIAQQVFARNLSTPLPLMKQTFKLGFRTRKNSLTKIYAEKASVAITKIEKETSSEKIDIKGQIHCNTSTKLTFIQGEKEKFKLLYNLQASKWMLQIKDSTKLVKPTFEINISLVSQPSKTVCPSTFILKSYSKDKNSLLTIWKAMEYFIKSYLHKDDLIQFFGYYQYKKNYSINLKLFNKGLEADILWKVLETFSNGDYIAEIQPIETIAKDMKLNKKDLITAVTTLKHIGFEIRSSNTNPQIPKNNILIPYSFPTLNERSLQRVKEL